MVPRLSGVMYDSPIPGKYVIKGETIQAIANHLVHFIPFLFYLKTICTGSHSTYG
jgi:glycopeptide antibiotics resistance protein